MPAGTGRIPNAVLAQPECQVGTKEVSCKQLSRFQGLKSQGFKIRWEVL